MRVLITYCSVQGQTRKIAQFISNTLEQSGHCTELCDASKVYSVVVPASYDVIIIGAPVHASGFPKAIQKWVKSHAGALAGRPSAFFSVCLGILQKDAKVQEEERKIVQNFFESTHWYPRAWTIFAGALPYTKYNWFLKRIMRRISRKAGGDTDITQDFEYTNWDEVETFTNDLVSKIQVLKERPMPNAVIG